LAAADSLVR